MKSFATTYKTKKVNKVAAIIVSTTMAFSLFATPAYAAGFNVKGDEGTYDYTDNTLTINMGEVSVSSDGQTSDHIVIAGDATLALAGVDIKADGNNPGIKVNPDVTAIIELVQDTANTVTGGTNHAGIEVGWQDDSTYADVTIKGEGSLSATGGSDSAGIGGSKGESSVYGNITIESGTIEATGTGGGAGIGSAGTNNGANKPVAEEWGTITINGGDITATGSNSAGIGGGNHVDSGEVVINDGNIVATGASGIGTGTGGSKAIAKADGTTDPGPGSTYADITINGGTITAMATGNDNWGGAGIGGGAYTDASVTINGGTINAYGGNVGSGHNSLHHGGAGIGGGYEGHADITINGGTVNAYVGENSSAAAIGSGGTPNSNPDRGNTGRVGDTYLDGTSVVITGGTVNAYANEYEKATDDGTVIVTSGRGGAGIGGGVSADNVSVSITGGTVTAYGAKSDEKQMQGGAGIGSGLQGNGQTIPGTTKAESSKYHSDTMVSISIIGGTVVAIGGWGAAGIGSGAANEMASSIIIDADNANVQAYADGTKFAIDTPAENAGSNTTVSGNVLQGTFVHKYTDSEGNEQGTEGLSSIIVKNDATGETKQLTLMPSGYRSYATDVLEPGTYTIYTDSNAIGATADEAHGAHFSVYPEDQWDGDDQGDKKVEYGVVADSLSNYLYLFPVKTIIVEKQIAANDISDEDLDAFIAGINETFYFAISDYKGDMLLDENGNPWIQSIEVVNGIPQGNAYFANMNDGEFEIWEVDAEGNKLEQGTQFGQAILETIRTTHGEGSDNNAQLAEGIWSDFVTITNTFVPIVEEKPEPVDPEPTTPEPVDPEPTTPETPETPEPAQPEAPVTPTEPENPATPEPEATDAEETEEPSTPVVPVGPTTPTTPSGPTTPTTPGGTTPTPSSPTTPMTPAVDTAVTTPTVATFAPTTAVATAAPAAAATTPEVIADEATPRASTPAAAEAIEDAETPMAAHEHGMECWVHWWILLGMLITTVYSVAVLIRRQSNSSKLNHIDQGTTSARKRPVSPTPTFVPKLQPAMSASLEA